MTELDNLLQLAELFDGLEHVVAWVKDREGRYVWVNRAFVVNYELSLPAAEHPITTESIIGKTDYDLSPSRLADEFRADDEAVFAGERITNRLEPVVRPDGTFVWSLTNKLPLRDAKMRIIAAAGMTRPLPPESDRRAAGSGLAAALEVMRENLRGPISNPELARSARMSVRAFERRFRSEFRVSPQEYLRRLRMQMACRALAYTRDTLAEIASACGFADQSHFTREFRRRMRVTPRAYRDRYENGAAGGGRKKIAAN